MKKLLAYHNNPELKAEMVADMRADIEADRLMAGHYWNGHTGCHVGCVLNARSVRMGIKLELQSHAAYEEVSGFPRALAHLLDGLFESLPNQKRQKLSIDVLEAIAPGADLSDVIRKWLIWLLADVRKYADGFDDVTSSIDTVITLLKEDCQDDAARAAAWSAARDAARAAARDAARAAARAAAWDAARAAAWSAARDAAWAAAWSAARDAQAEKLLELLKAAPMAELA